MAIDYFTKWVEVEPLATITSKRVLDFMVKSITCRFGLPKNIVSDNGTQFNSELFTKFCEKYEVIKCFSLVVYPMANGQVEAVNKTLKESLKKRFEDGKGLCLEQLPQVLWAYKTSHCTSTEHTPISLTSGSEEMLLVKTLVALHRQRNFNHE